MGASALLAVISLSLAWRVAQVPSELSTYVLGRSFVLAEQARNAPAGMTLIVGDSIVERAFHREACGATVFNAGISGARLSDLAPVAATLSSILTPSRIILAIGTNDAAAGRVVPTSRWIEDYEKLLAKLPADRLMLVAIPQVEAGKSSSGIIDVEDLAAKNRALRLLATRHGAIFVPSPLVATSDGVHPNAAGARAWLEAIQRHCPSPGSRNGGLDR
ncbi:SGNH/GDSL hydrolase family protein [Sphingomonas sp. ERG5]|uniref:SGNH/GDSL hydrolase family protein n=1 Tax=Sphingomonas sp. ERG5 TaxID=1381597 RepID=UPI00054BC547|nr:GDSL-type esterase/lipase family protein [Sphingomonas sp. ERG5]